MTKQLIIGLATLSIAGAGLIGSGMYAATTETSTVKTTRMEQRDPTAMLATLKTQVSAEAYAAFEALQTKQQTAMETLKASGTTPDKATLQASREALKTEMDTLMEQYPELSTALPQGKMGGRMEGRDGKGNAMQTILSGVSTEDKAALEAIRTEYKTKIDSVRTEEKAKIDAIIAKYPELKTEIDALQANRSTQKEGRGNGKMGGRGMMKNNTPSTTDATNAQ